MNYFCVCFGRSGYGSPPVEWLGVDGGADTTLSCYMGYEMVRFGGIYSEIGHLVQEQEVR